MLFHELAVKIKIPHFPSLLNEQANMLTYTQTSLNGPYVKCAVTKKAANSPITCHPHHLQVQTVAAM